MNRLKTFLLLFLLGTSQQLFAQQSEAISQLSIVGQLMQMLPLFIMLFFVFFFLVIKPQNKKLDDHRKMMSDLKRGTKVMIASGIHAKVLKVNEGDVDVEIAPNVKVKVNNDYISKAL